MEMPFRKGGFPSRKMVEDAIQQHDQFIGEEDGRIMAAYIMDHECDQIYDTVQWQIKADRNEIMILHALRVLPEYAGRGYSKKLVGNIKNSSQTLIYQEFTSC